MVKNKMIKKIKHEKRYYVTLRVPLQWWHLKQALWKTLLSAVNLSTRYTVLSQAMHFCWVPAKVAISLFSLEDEEEEEEEQNGELET
jgi:hypothetical protein